MDTIPFIIFGDGPRLSTGLARIAQDLTVRLWSVAEELGIRVLQVGVDEPEGWHFTGGWEFYGFQPTLQNFGRNALQRVVLELLEQGEPDPIVLAITDPARVYDLTRDPLPSDLYPKRTLHTYITLWGYYPIDAHNQNGMVGGPAGVCVRDTARVLGYGKYGAGVLRQTMRAVETESGAVPYLPHGIDTRTFYPRPLGEADVPFQDWYGMLPKDTTILGAVATNQPRKDLGLLFSSVATMHLRHPTALWLHTDLLTGRAWDVGELAVQNRFSQSQVFVSTGVLPDSQLAARYSASHATIAPGLGEGFGYPIVESLACGTPVVHGNYAGGVELIPEARWLVEPRAWRVESVYALQRPVFHPADVADVTERVVAEVRGAPASTRAYCRGAVGHLDWEHMWPRWKSWIAKGLAQEREIRSGKDLAPEEAR